MKVKLPRSYSGREIVDAFKNAVFQESSEEKMEAQEIAKEIQYESGSVKQVIRSLGVRIFPLSFRKKWIFFGQKVWKKFSYPNFILEPVEYFKNYEEVNIRVNYLIPCGRGSIIRTDLEEPKEFERLRLEFERILANFFARLS